ncbi:murein transglycosylase D [Shimwellia blattae]|uniref:peptidoglycan lytic exotransglycosylase n=1 Tax=Shimwellia blattae (strain ATCC 29907 / DSM 4481 / JCM 1650 / NBRC 105725 / CDC 9005-74) TaxID=630626 RepID=I2BCG6_SHIBC|nr:murein transglycosylase D [Shimwellia blattae]AFJ48220.1 membrane-bound lytic murein transglycosylase D precursor [Shimwellia blattae DSM 4481 = NBRC 105725]GAB82779.1 membrane-bound lytic murein transglycosylase D [Shimwellia blattae DSM 4481 = NBRC 105725]VDY65715.1 Membrane-bound lytic murein transglycosylase D precursor [Shimwellia blattae]VEC25485.1 Membrane-bound lytic murein transglycosylase D precursor [Shimwellia blattae]
MKAKAILLVASVLLAGCQSSKHDGAVQQHAQSLSAASQSEAAGRANNARWLDDGTSFAQNQNLWASISDELKMGIPENDRIREQKQKYLRNKSYLHDVTLRAEPYMYWIAGQVKKRNLPMELVLLPIVESAFNPHATSAANAAGIWQIVPSTGRNYGLKQTRNYDARRDVVASTTAALNMMQRLNRMFDGDWLLTVAAYNSGEGRVLKAIKANKARGKATDFWSLSLPQETKMYVPKMLALSEILKNNKKYGVRLPTPDESRALARVKVDSPVDMSQLAEVTGMSLTKLKAFNAGYRNTTVVGKNGPQYVMVPRKHAALVRKSIAAGDVTSAQPASSLAKNSGITYKVRRGDSLSSIARKHGVDVKDLMRWNTDADALRPGDQLTLYLRASDRPDT